MKDKGFKIVFALYIIVLIADIISTLRLGELVQYLEANGLYKHIGITGIIALNIILASIYYYIYKKGSINARFIVMFSLISIITIRLIAVQQNFAVGMNPPTIEQAMQVTQAAKKATMNRLAMLNILPALNGLFAWVFFKWDHFVMRRL